MTAHGLLRRGFDGEVLEPGHPDYDEASGSLFAVGTPAYIVRPRDVRDVRAAVRFAAGSGLPLSVRGGGHGFAGFATNDDGIVLDLRLLATVQVVDVDRRLVRVGGGATWGQVASVLGEHRLAISSGDTKSVGVGGLTLSGGIGWQVRKYGLALDALVGATVVTGAGQVVHASEDERPDLFWALRGGGGNFGVVTSFEFIAHPTTRVYHGKITFPAAETASVLAGWADYLRSAPEDLTSAVNLANPTAGGSPGSGPSGGVVEVHVSIDSDDRDRAAEALDPVWRLGTVVDSDVARTRYSDALVDGVVPPPGLRFSVRSAFVDTEAVPDALAVLAEASTSDGCPVIQVRSVGGAVAQVPADATAYPYRHAELLIVTMTAGPRELVDADRPQLNALWAQLDPHVRGAYANFLTDAGDAAVAAIYPPDSLQRLARIKRRYDPDNLFAANHNVPPA